MYVDPCGCGLLRMILRPGGIDIFYIDESSDGSIYAATAVTVPFLRPVDGAWHIVWPDFLRQAQFWRKELATSLKIPVSKELHGTKIMGGRGNYLYGKRQLPKDAASEYYRQILASIRHIAQFSTITVVGSRGKRLYGYDRLERVMYALFQRMRTQCARMNVNAMFFVDQGHAEYRDLYRRAKITMPTGSMFENNGINLPLDMFVKDVNEKSSKECLFTQTADLIAFAAFDKVRHELNLSTPDQISYGFHTLYDAIPVKYINKNASRKSKDGIVRLP
jgi:hypothetical protein